MATPAPKAKPQNKYNVRAIRKELDGYIRSFAWKQLRGRLQGLDLELRRAVIEERPTNHGLARKKRNTSSLLHALCDCVHATPPVPVDLLELVLEACPGLLTSSTGKSPLAIALDRQASPGLLECLLLYDTSRHSLYRTDNKTGDTPLLQAIKQEANDDVIFLLVQYDTSKESLLIPSKKRDRVPLFYEANHQLSFVHLGPEEIPGELEYILLQTHQALKIRRGEITPSAFVAPLGGNLDDLFGDLGISDDMGDENCDSWIEDINHEEVAGQSEEEYFVRLLHAVLACAHFLGNKNSVSLVGFLLSRISNISAAIDNEGNAVLHHFCQAEHCFAQSTLMEGRSILDTILQRHLKASEIPNLRGDLPLHLALQTEKPWREVVQTLVEAWPEAVSCTNAVNGRLSLHLAILHYPSQSKMIRNVWNFFPEAATVQDPVTRLLPFQLAALSDKKHSPKDTLDQIADIYFLLRASPQVLRSFSVRTD